MLVTGRYSVMKINERTKRSQRNTEHENNSTEECTNNGTEGQTYCCRRDGNVVTKRERTGKERGERRRNGTNGIQTEATKHENGTDSNSQQGGNSGTIVYP